MKGRFLILISALFILVGCKKEKNLSSKIEFENTNIKEIKYYQDNPKNASYSFEINIQLPKIISDTVFKDFRKSIIEHIFNVQTENNDIDLAISQYIQEKTDAFQEQGVDRFADQSNPYQLWSNLNCKFIYNKDNLCSYMIHEDNFTGGAHPYQEVYYLNYDLERKKKLGFEDIFIPTTPNDLALKEMLINQLMKQEKAKTIADLNLFDVESPKDFKISQMVYFDSLDIVFAYAQYDVRAYAYGAPEIKLPVNQVSKYFKEDFKERFFPSKK
ncbi:MAG: DUF4163 domain-containing protein [Bacteroidales bacterium]|jgi:hypothetical protein|nr:DUF4163 domain-containing protein [Bacteroidales bacterium]MDD4703384.1 DUF4163 domain-containing protein [Bacteroidales bacterium]MDX9797982.1 DUF4163 domain-containing protein [Bacteroidales bacterium]